MIIITELERGIKIEGHAGYAENGKDIVCSAISTLILTLVDSVEKLTDNNPVADVREGYALVKISSPTEETKILKECFFIGVGIVADEYPEFVQVTRRESH